jgi:hypothetical protein
MVDEMVMDGMIERARQSILDQAYSDMSLTQPIQPIFLLSDIKQLTTTCREE